MEVKASLNNLRISPRKVRLLATLVRGMEVKAAMAQLRFSNKQAGKPLLKLVSSAISNAENNFSLDKDNLKINKISVNEGFTLKRWLPRAHGRATVLRKRGSHVELILGEIVDSGVKEAKKQTIDKPVNINEIGNKPKKEKTAKDSKKSDDIKNNDDKQTEKKVEINDPKHLSSHDKVDSQSSKGSSRKMFRRKSG